MGLLTKGKPLRWEDSAKAREWVKEHGIEQFIYNYKHNKVVHACTEFLWGDEIEYMIIHAPDASEEKEKEGASRKIARISLRSHEVIETVEKMQNDMKLETISGSNAALHCTIHPEYGSFMIEGTPAKPYGNRTKDLRRVEGNMRERRAFFEKFLRNEELLVTMGNFPLLGAGKHTHPPTKPNGKVAQSIYVSDDIINVHPRFATLTRSIRKRRGKKVDIRVPIFRDINTENSSDIHMDAMAFGMGCSCLQVTFQAKHVEEARHLYDQLAILTPIMMALSANTPFHKGQVSDWDVRWSIISQSVDDRIPAERGFFSPSDLGGMQPGMLLDGLFEGPMNSREWCECKVIECNNPQVVVEKLPNKERVKIPRPDLYTRTQPHGTRTGGGMLKRLKKSRYDSISTFLMNTLPFKDEYNDIDCPIDEATYDKLIAAGIDHAMATHVAHLFVREPLVIYEERLKNLDDTKSSEHFENIQSTNWQNVRFKPPPTNSPNTGWRVEFRTLEVQLTDFENAAFVVFVALLSRAILFFDLDMYMPLSKVDENMSTAHRRDAVLNEKFLWRKDISNGAATNSLGKMSLKDIICGNEFRSGLTEVVRNYLTEIKCDEPGQQLVNQYLDLIEKRAKGELCTGARWQRNFIANHPLYNKDSIISEELCRELVEEVYKISHGSTDCKTSESLLGRTGHLRANEWDTLSQQLWSNTPSKSAKMSASRTHWRWKHRPQYGTMSIREIPYVSGKCPRKYISDCSPQIGDCQLKLNQNDSNHMLDIDHLPPLEENGTRGKKDSRSRSTSISPVGNAQHHTNGTNPGNLPTLDLKGQQAGAAPLRSSMRSILDTLQSGDEMADNRPSCQRGPKARNMYTNIVASSSSPNSKHPITNGIAPKKS